MKYISKSDVKIIALSLVVTIILTVFNMQISLRKARDAQRRGDLGAINTALTSFFADYGYFPPATADGKIQYCKNEYFIEALDEIKKLGRFDMEVFKKGLRGCEWGVDPLQDVIDNEVYFANLPKDPKSNLGYQYFYFSDGSRYQIYSYLEGGKKEQGYREDIIVRGVNCGKFICNYGRAYATTPLEISLEEYENELERQRNEK